MAASMNSPMLRAFDLMEMGKTSKLKKTSQGSARRLLAHPLGTAAMEAMFCTLYMRVYCCRA